MTTNPLLRPFQIPPFNEIRHEHYLPAIKQGIAEGLAEIDAIVGCPDAPSFENTIEALENAGALLTRVLGVFYPLLSADADDRLMDLSLTVSPLLSDYSSAINLNQALFQRVKAVYNQRDALSLSPEQQMLLEETYLGFTRNGANLQGTQRERFREISVRLNELSVRFRQNVKKELAQYSLPLEENQIQNLPEWLVDQMRENAVSNHSDAPYVLTLQAPEYTAFMRFSPHDDLRRKVYMMYSGRNRTGQYSNIEIIKEIVSLRLEKARILGYETYADFKLERTMAKKPSAALNLLNNLRDAYMPAVRRELNELRAFAGEEIVPWNYSYHSNRLRTMLYDFDPESLRPYFELSAVIGGVFGLAERLYGIQFRPCSDDIPLYHSDVKAFKVTDADGSLLGLLYTDFFPRAGRKSPGAWMTDFREADACRRPLVNIVMNFTKPTAERPSLLSPDEVTTFLHEFGHALHSLLTKVGYASLAGTNVDRDFVELPSQFHENYFYSREFLDGFARHYQTGEPLPDDLFGKLISSQKFGAAFACVRQLNFGYLDMAFHSVCAPVDSVDDVEINAIKQVEIFPHVPRTLIAPSFGHIFSGGYAAGYYSYKWAEVLDADAFALFQERGIFNPDLAKSFRKNILERGGSAPAADLYYAFRGQAPSVAALLARDGITPQHR